MERNWDLQLRRAKNLPPHKWESLRPTRFPLPDHDDDDTSKHCKDCLVTRLHRPYMAIPLWFSQNHVTEMDDLRETIFGSSAYKGGSSSSLHRLSTSRSSAVGVSYIRKDHLPDWTQIKSHNNTKLNRMEQHRFLYLRRACRDSFIIYLWMTTTAQNLYFNEFERQPRSSKEGKVYMQKNACTECTCKKMLVPNLDHQGFLSYMKDSILRSSSPSYLFLYIVY